MNYTLQTIGMIKEAIVWFENTKSFQLTGGDELNIWPQKLNGFDLCEDMGVVINSLSKMTSSIPYYKDKRCKCKSRGPEVLAFCSTALDQGRLTLNGLYFVVEVTDLNLDIWRTKWPWHSQLIKYHTCDAYAPAHTPTQTKAFTSSQYEQRLSNWPFHNKNYGFWVTGSFHKTCTEYPQNDLMTQKSRLLHPCLNVAIE